MIRTLDILASAICVLMCVYLIAFALVGACVIGSSMPVNSCRDNVAGQIVYKTISIAI